MEFGEMQQAEQSVRWETATRLAAPILLAFLFAMAPAPVQAQSGTLVTNSGESSTDGNTIMMAQSFTTGPSTVGYALAGVQFSVTAPATSSAVTVFVTIREDGSDGRPGDVVVELSTPVDSMGRLNFNGDDIFRAPANTRLNPNTTYWVVVNNDAALNSANAKRARFALVSGTGQRGMTGWSIGNVGHWRNRVDEVWEVDRTSHLRFTVLGSIFDVSDDTAPPTIESISVDSWWVTLTFSEPLDESQGGSPGRFRVENITERLISGVTVRTRSRIELEGGQIRPVGRTVALMTRYPFPSWFNENSLHVEVSYNRPGSGGIQDLNGNRTRSFSRHRADILTNNRSPTLLQATLNGDEIDLDYNWALNRGGAGPHARAFSVRRPDGAAVAVTAVSVAGGSVTLTLASAARYRESGWRVSYDPSRTTRPLLYGQTNVRSFSGIELLNHTPAKLAPALKSAVWHDNWIRLTYNQDVKAVAPPAKAYTVSADRAVFKVKSTSVFNELVVLRLPSAVPASVDSCGLRVSYDPPSSNAVTGKASERAAPALDAEPVKRLRLGEGEGEPCDGLSVADAQGTEGRHSAITFTVGLRPAPTSRVTVRYATSDGTARRGSDYTSTRGTLTFDAGESTKTVDVPHHRRWRGGTTARRSRSRSPTPRAHRSPTPRRPAPSATRRSCRP